MRTTRLLFPFLILFIFISCKKYEEGPVFSLRSKKERVANDWRMHAYFENGVDKTTDYLNIYQGAKYSMSKTENFVFSYKFLGVIAIEQSGEWHFNSNKTGIIFTQLSPSADSWVLDIKRLKEKEMWLTESDSGITKEYHLSPF